MSLNILSRMRIRINRRELAGAFGDIGTDLPLLTGMVLASGMHPATVLIVFGAAQVVSALFYGIPMPVQPLKAVAALVIAGGISSSEILGAGLGIGVIMLLLTATGLLDRLNSIIPKAVIRGIQLGLGIKLALLALTRYIPSDGYPGLILALICAAVILLLLKRRAWPSALIVVGIGFGYAVCRQFGAGGWGGSFGITLPQLGRFTAADVLQGTIILALPQIPLSLGNSLFATHQAAEDLFPERRVKLSTIGYTYSLLNIVTPFLGGIPVCHGSGGMVGHHLFGGRTGGSVLIYGLALAAAGLFFGNGCELIVSIFPLPVLGVILLAEGVALMRFVSDIIPDRFKVAVTAVTAASAVLLPCGFLVGLMVGTAVAHTPSAVIYMKTRLGGEVRTGA